MKIGLDIDNVLIDYTRALSLYLFNEERPSPTCWNFTDWGISRELFEEKQIKLISTGCHLFKPYEDTKKALDELRTFCNVHLITHRATLPYYDDATKSIAITNTIKMLDTFDLKYDSIHFTHEKWTVSCDIYLDDSPGVIREFLLRGLKGYVYTHPYNLDCPSQKVNSLSEFVKEMRKKYEKLYTSK